MIGKYAAATLDALPFALSAEDRARLEGLAASALPLEAGKTAEALFDADPARGPALLRAVDGLRRTIAEGLHGDAARRLADLRAELARRGLDGFLVPMADAHQGEYLPPDAQRLAWLTGFTGSAGIAVVLKDKAAIFVDGRYTLQVRDQVDTSLYTPRHLTEQPPASWLAEEAPDGAVIGYDPWLHTKAGIAAIAKAVADRGGVLTATQGNPVDAIWSDRPPAPLSPMIPHGLEQAGEAHEDKITRLAAGLAAQELDAAVISAPDALAWLLNVRGFDVPNNPLSLGFAILHADEGGHVALFVDPRKLSAAVRSHLGNRVEILPPEALAAALDELGAKKARVRIDAATGAVWFHERLEAAGAQPVAGLDPCALPRSRKNAAEMRGTRHAHVRDGAAVSTFLHWLDGAVARGEALDELAIVDRLAACRAASPLYRGNSFDTIAGFGPNGAIVHYRATPASNLAFSPGNLLLLDSGAQYLDGTTDVTRTMAIGAPSPEHRDRYTRVLKGHIALGGAYFPKGTTGSQLDALARAPLWQAGLDYDHGTGHGVGSFLCVHEGPQRISKVANAVALEPGMIVSDEPGYYKTGAYGIRIENLIAVTDAPAIPGGDRRMLCFETLTLIPYDRRLIEADLLDAGERRWVDDYHARVFTELSPLVPPEVRDWLRRACAPLGEETA